MRNPGLLTWTGRRLVAGSYFPRFSIVFFFLINTSHFIYFIGLSHFIDHFLVQYCVFPLNLTVYLFENDICFCRLDKATYFFPIYFSFDIKSYNDYLSNCLEREMTANNA